MSIPDCFSETIFHHMKCTVRAEASTCRSAIRVARGVVDDIGASAAQKSVGLYELSKCQETNSERDINVLVRRYDLTLPVKISTLPKTPGARYHGDFSVISLKDWCTFLLQYNCWHVMCGLSRPDPTRERAILAKFWEKFKVLQPDHDVWGIFERQKVDASLCCPIVVHGDEGRGRKKAPFLVMAYHSLIGRGTQLSNKKRVHRSYTRMRLNYNGNSRGHRLITSVLPKMSKDEISFQAILSFVTQDCIDMVTTGVANPHGGAHYRMVTLNCIGDWAFLVKAGQLARSFNRVEKRPRAAGSVPAGICHYCHAGKLDHPFEDFGPEPRWERTLFLPGDSWYTSRPTLLGIPCNRIKEPAFFTFDLWHSFHLGLGKTYVASVLALLSDRMRATSVDDRFIELSNIFLQWCDETHTSSYISSFTKDTCGWPDRKTYPNGMWSKGHITTTFMQWLAAYMQSNDFTDCPILSVCVEATIAMNECLEEMYASDLFLSVDAARRISGKGLRFLLLYKRLARMSFDVSKALFVFMPKGHVVHHVFHELAVLSSQGKEPINPLAFAVQIDEDFVGKSSRLSRRVGPGQVVKRTLERSLQAAYKQWIDEGYLKG